MPILQRILLTSNITSKRTILSSSVWLTKKDPPDSSASSSTSSSSSDSDSDDEKAKNKKQTQQPGNVSQKLSSLLQRMVEEEKNMPLQEKLNLAKPRQIQRQEYLEKQNEKKYGEKLATAAKEVAEDLGGDVKQTEMELLEKLLFKKTATDDSGKPSKSKHHPDEDTKQDLGALSLSELLSEMKIDRTKTKPDAAPQFQSRADQVRSMMRHQQKDGSQRPQQRPRRPMSFDRTRTVESINLFGGEPFGFFKDLKAEAVSNEVKLDVWDKCAKRELRLAVTQPPTNIYEEMIQWTNKGMLWHFPIDNEQGLEKEKQVYFSEHVHLEHHLEGWCPDKGPIRNFMELVCVGLSKNYWLSVEEKKEYIDWFRDFFVRKREMIKEIGAGDIQPEV
ncbi:28S ribosomal protein S31, mitochondrial [Nilaparvata lugens]|uniref:28S ribosomal protein S31, mitochondrial n=1 Tax=Nilaparvata lugens TaxID=108931 RepID=UPI00193CE94F|nr:28S ribosomal protein S31, mitochondrial [Nilaparvata lugens]